MRCGCLLVPAVEKIDPKDGYKARGKFREVPFQTAIRLTNMAMYSDRMGNYVLAKESPGMLWSPIQSDAATRFFWNRQTKKLYGKRFGKLLFVVNTVNA